MPKLNRGTTLTLPRTAASQQVHRRNLNSPCAIVLFVCILSLSGGMSLGDAAPSGAVFVAGFDGSVTARGASGREIQPLKADKIEFAPGLKGQALQAFGCALTYAATALPKEQGSLVMGVSPRLEGAQSVLGGGTALLLR